MGTSASIIVEDHGLYRVIHCWYDGYLAHMAPILQDEYGSKKEALHLVKGGNMQGLYSDTPIKRERTIRSNTKVFDSLKEAVEYSAPTQYIYLFKDSIWSLVDEQSLMRLYWYRLDEECVHLECAICGYEEFAKVEDSGGWIAEVFWGQHNLGHCCPQCTERYTQMGDQSEFELVISKVDMNECTKLAEWIAEMIIG